MVSDLAVLIPLSTALQQLIDDISFFSVVHASSFDLRMPYITYCRGGKVDCSVADVADPFMFYDFAAGRVYLLLQEAVACCKHAPGH